MEWLTNDPKVAAILRKADREYEQAVARAGLQKLAAKVAAIREAKARRLAMYDFARELEC